MPTITVAYCYTRKSPTDSLGTVEQHDAEACEYVRLHLPGFTFTGGFVDEADAERSPLTSRPAGLRVSLTADRGDAVIIPHFGRAFRSARELVEVLDVWAARGVSLYVLDVHLDPTTPAGRLVAAVFRVLAAAETAKAKERGALDFARRRMRGLPLNGQAPPCHRYVGPRGKRRLVQDPYVRQVAGRVVDWRDRGFSWESIFFHLREQGVRQRSGREFSLTALRRLDLAERGLRADEEKTAARVGAAS